MKKLSFCLAAILSGATLNSFAKNNCNNVGVPFRCNGGFSIELAALYLRSNFPESDYALTQRVDDFFHSDVHRIDPDYHWGYSLAIGYLLPCSANDITLTYLTYDHDSHDSVAVSTNESEVLLPTLSALPTETFLITDIITSAIPATVPVSGSLEFTPTDPDSIKAKTDFRLQVLDLDLGQKICQGQLTTRFFGGLRWANIRSETDVTTFQTVNQPSETVTLTGSAGIFDGVEIIELDSIVGSFEQLQHQNFKFNGIGPHFGATSHYQLGCTNFGITGTLSSALFIGEADSSIHIRDITNLSGAVTEVTATINGDPSVVTTINPGDVLLFNNDSELNRRFNNETRIVPNVDAKLGVYYGYRFGCNNQKSFNLEAGYLTSYYWNSLDRLSDTSNHIGVRHTTDVNFDGFYISAQVQL